MSNQALTIIALAWHEAAHLVPCFRSLAPLIAATNARTLIVLDAEADEETASAARRVAEKVVTHEFVNFSAQRNYALDQARTGWVLFIDADERCTSRLATEIAAVLAQPGCAAYRVPRRNFFFKHEVRHTGWYPDYQIRLLQRAHCRYDQARQVHELPEVEGPIGTLHAPLIHFNYDNWAQFLAKQRAYSALEARALFNAGREARLRSLIGQPLREFKRRYIDYSGYKDGPLGLALSFAMSLYVAQTYRKLLILQRRVKGET